MFRFRGERKQGPGEKLRPEIDKMKKHGKNEAGLNFSDISDNVLASRGYFLIVIPLLAKGKGIFKTSRALGTFSSSKIYRVTNCLQFGFVCKCISSLVQWVDT